MGYTEKLSVAFNHATGPCWIQLIYLIRQIQHKNGKNSITENLDCTASSSSSLNTDLQLYDSTDLPYPHSTVVSTSFHEKHDVP